jgi:hypothetical protein
MSTKLARAYSLDMVTPAHAVQRDSLRGIETIDPRHLGIVQGIAGGAKGFATTGDLITQTADGRDLNDLWNEFQSVNEEYNRQRQTLVDFLTYSVNSPIEEIPVLGSQGDFEEASEFGVPKAYRPEFDSYSMGFGFKWYDLANRFTWQFLAEAPASQVQAIENQALEADSRLVFSKIMRQLFRNTTDAATIRGNAYNVYGFYNGVSDDAGTPPSYKTNTFSNGHNHFLVSGAATVDQGDLEEMANHLAHHGYNRLEGYRTVVIVNTAEGNVIRNFRSTINGGAGMWDFIPAQGQPTSLLDINTQIINGSPVPGELNGLNVIGSYGDLIVVQEDYIPAGYLVAFATGGRDNLQNPIGFREHANSGLRGMRLVKGRNADYPLLDAYYVRGFGTGIRHRGAGVVMQVKASGSYAPPAIYA